MQTFINILGLVIVGINSGAIIGLYRQHLALCGLLSDHWEAHRAAKSPVIHPRKATGYPEEIMRRNRPNGINWDEYRNGR